MILEYSALEKSIDKELKSIYLLYGEEQYLVEKIVNKIKKNFGEKVLGINFIKIDDSNVDTLLSNIEMPAFGYDKKLIIAKNTGLFKKDGRKKVGSPLQELVSNYIKENMDIINSSIILVFIEESADSNVMYDQVQNNGIVCNIEELKPYQIVKNLKQVCKLYNISVDDVTLNYLVETAGTSLRVLMNEIRKLIEYVGNGGTITLKDVNLLTTKQIENVIFDLSDYIATKKINKSIEILDNLISQKEAIQKILVLLYNHFKKLYMCMLAVELNKDIVNSLSLKPNQTFLISKYKTQAKNFTKEELKRLMKELVELDYKNKNYSIDLELGLKSVLCTYCS